MVRYILIYSRIYVLSCVMWLGYPSSYDLTGSIVSTSSCSSRRSYLSNWYTYITRSVILSPLSSALSLKILPISRSSTRGIVSPNSIYCLLLLIPPSLASVYYAALIALILSVNNIIPSYFYYIKKGLVCIIIMAPSSH